MGGALLTRADEGCNRTRAHRWLRDWCWRAEANCLVGIQVALVGITDRLDGISSKRSRVANLAQRRTPLDCPSLVGDLGRTFAWMVWELVLALVDVTSEIRVARGAVVRDEEKIHRGTRCGRSCYRWRITEPPLRYQLLARTAQSSGRLARVRE